jgi:uncharacterized protein (TIGR02246 family)
MKTLKVLVVLFLFLLVTSSTFAQDKEDVLAVVNNALEAFNQHNLATFFSYFTTDVSVFTYVVSPLRHDAADFKSFIEGTTSLAYVNLHQQEYQVQIYNADAAVVTGYFTFTWMEKGGQMNYQTGRVTTVEVKQDGKWLIAHMHFSKMF